MSRMSELAGWILFLLIIILIYGGMHLYVFNKVQAAFRLSARSSAAAAVFMTVMVFSVIIGHLVERMGSNLFASLVLHISYIWLGLIFLFFMSALVIDVYRLSVYASGALTRQNFSTAMPSPMLSFFLPLMLAIVLNIYGYFEAKNIRTKEIVIKTSKLPKESNKIRIVQVSDIHLGVMVSKKRLRRIIEMVKKTKPDILVSTGDLVDSSSHNIGHFVKPLSLIDAKYGKFAVTGNHEFYTGLNQALEFTQDVGFTVLRGEGVTVAGVINIAGVDDPTAKRFGGITGKGEVELLSELPSEHFTVLLKHMPVVNNKAINVFDLQLSGHAHGGQIFPFSLLTRLVFITDHGLLSLSKHSRIYVSRGTGVWGPPIRVMAPPEITVIDLVHKGE
ncbi:MAG: metallophosphoesterase [Deltaproteobacteria bacterium]|nr:metallophosphoesterase [Deltaproteobacteria bacterium]